MHSRRAAIILGGFLLGSIFLVFLASAILAQEPPEPPHQFSGEVTRGGQPDVGVEVRVRIREGGKLRTIALSSRSVNVTDPNGRFGESSLFVVPAETADDGQELLFYLVAEPGAGEATGTPISVVNAGGTVELSLEPRSPRFTVGTPFPVDIVVSAGTQLVKKGEAHINFDPALVEVSSVSPGNTLGTVSVNTFDNSLGTLDYVAEGGPTSGDFTLATVNFNAKVPVKETSISFNTGTPRRTAVEDPGGGAVLRGVSGLDLEDVVVRAVTEIADGISRTIAPVFFEVGGLTRVNLAIFGAPGTWTLSPTAHPTIPDPHSHGTLPAPAI